MFRFVFFVFSLMIVSSPSKSLELKEIVVPFGPGGPTGTFARIVQQYLKEDQNINSVVMHKPGADGIIGARYVADSPADGNKFLIVTTGFMFNFVLYNNLGYTYSDFEMILPMTKFPGALIVSNNSNINSMTEFISAAKSRPINCGVSNSATLFITKYMIKQLGLTNVEIIPFKGGGEVAVSLLNGTVDCAFDGVPFGIEAHKAGRQKIISISNKTKMSILPDASLYSEYVPGFVYHFWQGVAILKNSPPAEKQALVNMMRNLTLTTQYKERVTAMHLDPVTPTINSMKFFESELLIFESIRTQLGISKNNF